MIDKLVSSLQAALREPEVRERFTDLGAVTYGPEKQTPAALEAHLKAEIAKWAPLIESRSVRSLAFSHATPFFLNQASIRFQPSAAASLR